MNSQYCFGFYLININNLNLDNSNLYLNQIDTSSGSIVQKSTTISVYTTGTKISTTIASDDSYLFVSAYQNS